MTRRSGAQRGVALMEVLIAMLIVAFGVLGFVGLQTQTTVSQVEAYQRSQALILVNDMAQRMSLNRANAAAYVGTDIGTTNPGDCTVIVNAADKDLCEWSALIRGEAEKSGTTAVGAVLGARGCITNTGANQYLISIAWQGLQATGAPANSCGLNAYTQENLRRVVNTVLRMATLT
ncbi:MAG TPA: type IV pilus modification protein PilV [Burkholderiaceae bacterium]|nr:type IV pilus modification protein PilV [Burkholderiaceae bacterium]